MPRLVLVRHARPAVEPDRPPSQWRLSDEGREQCRELARQLAPLGVRRVVASVEPKAWQTGAIVAQRLGVPCSAAPDLHEHDRDGAPYLAARADVERAVAELFARPDELVYGRETAAQVRDRVAAAVDGVLVAYPDQTVAIATHGTAIALFLAARCGIDPLPFWRALRLPDLVVLERPSFALVDVTS